MTLFPQGAQVARALASGPSRRSQAKTSGQRPLPASHALSLPWSHPISAAVLPGRTKIGRGLQAGVQPGRRRVTAWQSSH